MLQLQMYCDNCPCLEQLSCLAWKTERPAVCLPQRKEKEVKVMLCPFDFCWQSQASSSYSALLLLPLIAVILVRALTNL